LYTVHTGLKTDCRVYKVSVQCTFQVLLDTQCCTLHRLGLKSQNTFVHLLCIHAYMYANITTLEQYRQDLISALSEASHLWGE
jgi:hypothetical protein